MTDETDTVEMADGELQATMQDLRETLCYQNGLADGMQRAREYVLNEASALWRRGVEEEDAAAGEIRGVALRMGEVLSPLFSQRNTTQHNMDGLHRELERRRGAKANG